jgi:phosphomannomutase/phosphoglucomutase
MPQALPAAELFKAYDIRGIVDTVLTAAAVRAIGHALGAEAVVRGQQCDRGRARRPPVRPGARRCAEPTASALRVSTSSTSAACPPHSPTSPRIELGCDSCVSVTGSHNPPDYNGLKIVLGGQTLLRQT